MVRVCASAATPAWPGSHQPLGATWSAESTNFAVFAPEAWAVEVCLFDDASGREVETRYALTEKTLGIWHGAVPGCRRASATASAPTGPGSRIAAGSSTGRSC